MDSEYSHIAFGLCDLGLGFPELGSVDLNELAELKIVGIFKVERDLFFEANFPISVYARAASAHQSIVESDDILKNFIK